MRRFDIIIVIAGLAVAAGFAVPRHAGLAREARRAEVESLARSARNIARLAHINWLAAGSPATLEGTRGVVAISNGYPSRATLPLLLSAAEVLPFAYGGGAWQHREVPAGRYCGVLYAPPSAPGATPSITARLDGC
jgi:hypothetical protein